MASCNDDFAELEAVPKNEPKAAPKPVVKVPRNRVSVVVGHASSTLVFEGTIRVNMERRAVLATYERRVATKWTLQFAAGAIATGTLKVASDVYQFGPGWSAGISTSYRALDGRGSKPFLLLGGTLAFAGATTQGVSPDAPKIEYLGGDLRLSVVVGKTIFQALSPYAVVRGFGGPIWWKIANKDIVGTDAYKFQVGAGLAVAMPWGLDAFIEGVPLGEKALSTGLGYSF